MIIAAVCLGSGLGRRMFLAIGMKPMAWRSAVRCSFALPGMIVKAHLNRGLLAAMPSDSCAIACTAEASASIICYLGRALLLCVPEISGTMRGHKRADFSVFAFDRFDANAEIEGEPEAIASRWKNARTARGRA